MNINHLFEALAPSEKQKTEMWSAILVQKNEMEQNTGGLFSPIKRKLLVPIAVFFLMCFVSVTVYAATDGKVISAIRNQVNQIFFSNGDSIELQINDAGETSVGINGIEGEWLIQDSGDRIILMVNGEEIDIKDELSSEGYFYYEYRDEVGVLHRVYVVKNAGGSKDYSERWYSQFEWLPGVGVGGSRGISGPLATAIMNAESEAANGTGDLDAMLQQYLGKYWIEYGN